MLPPPYSESHLVLEKPYGSLVSFGITDQFKSVQWWHNGVALSNDNRHTINSSGTLIISSAIVSDAGIYQVDITRDGSPRREFYSFTLQIETSKLCFTVQ